MTKAGKGTITRCGKDIANLDVAIGHNDAINEQFDQRSTLLEGGLAESRAYLGAEGVQRCSDSAKCDTLARRGLELAVLDVEALLPAAELVLLAPEGHQVEYSCQIGVE
jgi:hypothetical protein